MRNRQATIVLSAITLLVGLLSLPPLALGVEDRGGPSRLVENGNVNGDRRIDITDVIFLLDYLFSGGPPPVRFGEVCDVAAGAEIYFQILAGTDRNSSSNPFVQPQDPALAGGGRDQTLQFGDVLEGSACSDLLLGGLGVDVLMGKSGDDVILGGTEHFNPQNRDRAFGGAGRDVFVWAPGDGSDFFDGGDGWDALVLGLVGETVDGETVFRVSNDQRRGDVALDAVTQLPTVDVTSSPGFCTVIDGSVSTDAAAELEALNIDHLVQFSIRGIASAFENGDQSEDNGLRVTMHLKDVEFLVCTTRAGGEIEVLDLRVSPPQATTLEATGIPALELMVR